jgi:hypothetical protein
VNVPNVLIGRIFKLDGGVVEKIISLTAGKPYLIQKICISLVSRLHEQRRRKITIADVVPLHDMAVPDPVNEVRRKVGCNWLS